MDDNWPPKTKKRRHLFTGDDGTLVEQTAPFVHVLSSLIFEQVKMDMTPVSLSGIFDDRYVQEYMDYKNHAPGHPGSIGSPGFGYSKTSIARMQAEGFYTGPAVSVCTMHWAENLSRALTDEEETAGNPFTKLQTYFAPVGIRTTLVRGDAFPGLMQEYGLVVDCHEPEFKEKLAPLFLRDYAKHCVDQLTRPANLSSQGEYLSYYYALFHYIRAFNEKHGIILAASGEGATSVMTLPDETDKAFWGEWAVKHAHYHWEMAQETMTPMFPVFTTEQREGLLRDIIGGLVSNDRFRHQSGLQLKGTPFSAKVLA